MMFAGRVVLRLTRCLRNLWTFEDDAENISSLRDLSLALMNLRVIVEIHWMEHMTHRFPLASWNGQERVSSTRSLLESEKLLDAPEQHRQATLDGVAQESIVLSRQMAECKP